MLFSLTNLEIKGHYFFELLLSLINVPTCTMTRLEGQAAQGSLSGYCKTIKQANTKHTQTPTKALKVK